MVGQRYDIQREIRVTKHQAAKLGQVPTVSQLRTVEGRVALRYWEALRRVLPEWLDFQGRMTTTHQNNVSEPFNAALNYGYGFLESECRMAINAVGLEPTVGFLHEFSSYQTKHSLAYDLQEPFRWLVDLWVILAFESNALDFWSKSSQPRSIDVETVRKTIPLERLSEDMELEFVGLFPKHSDLRMLAVRLILSLRESGPRSQSQLAQELEVEPFTMSRLLAKLESSKHIMGTREGIDKVVSLPSL